MAAQAQAPMLLLVEDDPNQRLLYEMELADDGCRTVSASTLAETLAVIGRDPPDLVVLDLRLGSEEGFDILSQIKRSHPSLPVIVHTGYAPSGGLAGDIADAFVLKSSDLQPLKRTVRSLIGNMVGKSPA